jgi:hypothetical protein
MSARLFVLRDLARRAAHDIAANGTPQSSFAVHEGKLSMRSAIRLRIAASGNRPIAPPMLSTTF